MVFQGLPSTLHILSHLSSQHLELGAITISILQWKKLRQTEVVWLVQGHTTKKCLRPDLNLDFHGSSSIALSTVPPSYLATTIFFSPVHGLWEWFCWLIFYIWFVPFCALFHFCDCHISLSPILMSPAL